MQAEANTIWRALALFQPRLARFPPPRASQGQEPRYYAISPLKFSPVICSRAMMASIEFQRWYGYISFCMRWHFLLLYIICALPAAALASQSCVPFLPARPGEASLMDAILYGSGFNKRLSPRRLSQYKAAYASIAAELSLSTRCMPPPPLILFLLCAWQRHFLISGEFSIILTNISLAAARDDFFSATKPPLPRLKRESHRMRLNLPRYTIFCRFYLIHAL